ncbi:PepSY domain-containing protein [Chryseobacterium sp. SL1]|uniref:PepSY domain-containing protein n=1 Tax=Chryseobacterium sp. SL1 TaxID=2995159 RepID=UPI00227310EA|nr:PepSY domain-containing protein [Chryseobacterium sp. SL1]MCY1659357.1 PepSY domain-containing protein [Chryseobacterium sp. SL1]
MITKEKALEIVKKYVIDRKRNYIEIINDKINFEENIKIPYGKYDEQKRTIYTITCRLEGYLDPISHYITVDAETGEVLFTATPHGYAEEWEE